MILRDPVSDVGDGDLHIHTFYDSDYLLARVEFANFDEKGSDVNTEVTVFWEDNEEPFFGPAKLNLMADRSVTSMAKALDYIQEELDAMWNIGFPQAARTSVRALRAMGKEERYLKRRDPDTAPEPFLINPFVSAIGTTHLYSPPGAGKSLVALGIAYSIATGQPIFGATPSKIGPVLYLDFEDGPETHDDRLNAICNGYGYEGIPPIMHLRLRGGLRKHIRYIKAVTRKEGAVAFILDSVGKAKSLTLNDGEAAIQLFDDLDRLVLPGVAVDHVTKVINEQIKRQKVHAESVMAIGSQFSTAATRLGWFMHEQGSSTPTTKRFNMHNTKHNHVARQETRRLFIHIETNDRALPVSMQFEVQHGMFEIPLEAESKPVQIARAMARTDKPMTYEEITEATGIKRNTLAPILTNHDFFTKGENMGRQATYSVSRKGSVALEHFEQQQQS